MNKIIFTLLLCCFCQTAHADINTGLVSWYKLNDGSGTTAVDSGSAASNGTLTGSPLPSWTASAKIGSYALSNPGSAGYVSASGSPVSSYPYTLSAWVYVNGGTHGTIAGLSYPPGSGGIRSELYVNNDTVCLYVENTSFNFFCSASGTVPTSQWHLATGVYTSATDFSLYLDGTYITNGTTSVLFSAATNFQIGVDSDVGNYLNANIDDVRVYNRALSANDIQELYNYTGLGAQIVQSKACYVATTCTFTSNVTAGNTIFVITAGSGSQSGITVSDTLGNTFVQDVQSGSANAAAINSAYSASGGADTVTRSSGSDNGLIILEVSGIKSTSPLDITDAATTIGATNSPTSNSFTTTNNNDFILSAYVEEAGTNTGGAGTGYSFIAQNTGQYSLGIYATNKAAGSQQAIFSVGGSQASWTVVTAAYKQAGGVTPFTDTLINSARINSMRIK